MGKTARYMRSRRVNSDGTIEQDFLDSLNTEKINAILAVPTDVDQNTTQFKKFEADIYARVDEMNELVERQKREKEEEEWAKEIEDE